MLANPTGGIFQSDHHHIAITVESGAAGHVTTQSSTKVHSMPHGRDRQNVELVVASSGYLEYLPDPVIPTMTRTSSSTQPSLWRPGVRWSSGTYWHPGGSPWGSPFDTVALAIGWRCSTGQVEPHTGSSFEIVPSRHYPLVRGMLGAPRSEQRGSTLGSMLVIAELGRLEPLVVELQESLPSTWRLLPGLPVCLILQSQIVLGRMELL